MAATSVRRVFRASVLVLVVSVLALASCGGDQAEDTTAAAPSDQGQVEVVYEDDAIEPENRDAVEVIRESGVLERLAAWTSEAVALPHDIEMKVSDDMPEGVASPVAEPDGRTILLPASFFTQNYGVLTDFVEAVNREGGPPTVFPEGKFNADDLTALAEEFIVAHEMGHALMHQLELPITGLEEDAADGFATFYTVNQVGRGPAIAGSMLVDELAREQGDPTVEDFASDHPITQQRVYNFLCLVAGSDPDKLEGPFVEEGYLPEDRAIVCPLEWAQLNFGWWTVLEPHLSEAFKARGTESQGQALEQLRAETDAFAAEVKKLRGQ
jgi:hypothetical protein